MNITKEQADKVIAALSMNRIMARDENGNYTKEITAQVVVEALSIMRGLAEDAEPVNRCITELLAFAKDHPGTYIFPSWDGSRVMKYLATSPQAAQTAVKSESLAQAAQAPARLPSEGKTIEALAPTEAQEREAFEAFMLTKYPAHLCHWVGDQYSEMFTRLVFVGWKAGRAGSKP
mgnify:CR=1 FL=1